jgi:hypothetical protein
MISISGILKKFSDFCGFLTGLQEFIFFQEKFRFDWVF